MNDTHRRVERFVQTVMSVVQNDLAENIPERHPERNSGEALLKRIGGHFKVGRRGDAKEARRIYSAVRWLIEIHETDDFPTVPTE